MMGFNVPYAQRHLRRDPGVHTFKIVTWFLATLSVGVFAAVLGGILYLLISYAPGS